MASWALTGPRRTDLVPGSRSRTGTGRLRLQHGEVEVPRFPPWEKKIGAVVLLFPRHGNPYTGSGFHLLAGDSGVGSRSPLTFLRERRGTRMQRQRPVILVLQ